MVIIIYITLKLMLHETSSKILKQLFMADNTIKMHKMLIKLKNIIVKGTYTYLLIYKTSLIEPLTFSGCTKN